MKTPASRTCAVKAHTRVLPVRPSIDDDLHRRLARELLDCVRVEAAMREWAAWFPGYFIRCFAWRFQCAPRKAA